MLPPSRAPGHLAALVLSIPPPRATAQTFTLANPHRNITLSDFGYSDFLLDNTPGFEGREYLSGEWGAAVGYQIVDRPVTPPEWLEPQFIFPDWTTRSRFRVVTPLTQTGLNADGLPIAQSVIDNREVEITLRYEMLDTVVGTPMGTMPASATGATTFLLSDRYVLKQSASIKNISGAAMSNVQFFQLLHGLQSQRGLYDHRPHTGPLSEFRYDVTQAGVDAAAVGAGSSSAGLEDFIGFHASVAPSAYEIGYFGIEGNGVDDHAMGKPSDGVHLSIEDNWQSAPYGTRMGTDNFAPAQRWVAGAQRWNLGTLAPNQSAALDVLLTLRTGTRVVVGTGSSGGCNGGDVYPDGAGVTVEATAFPGYVFLNWTENGEPASTSASYSFTSEASRTLIANFIAQPGLSAVLTAPGVLTLSWPAGASGWTQQESADLSPGSWADSTRPVTVVGNQKRVLVAPLVGRGFFRLTHP